MPTVVDWPRPAAETWATTSLVNEAERDTIPIWIAALGPKNVEQTAEIADGWIPHLFHPERAHRVFKEIVGSFEEPPMEPGVREELAEFVARRKAEGGAPTDF